MNRFFTKSKNPYFWAQIGPKNFFFRKIFFHNQDTFILRLCTKNQEKLMNRFFTKSKKPYFFFENRGPSHFGHYHFAPLCQKSEKTNEPTLRKVGNRQTNGRTDTGQFKGPPGRSKKSISVGNLPSLFFQQKKKIH